MKRFVLVAVAACSSPTNTPSPVVAKHASVTPPAIIRGGHSAAIEIVTTTDDGHAAVTQDAMGGTRLWPALDGTVEPVVVRLVPVRELALGRDGTGFVIAGLDPAGALELVRVAATGATSGHTQIGNDVAIEQIAMTPRGVLALRADQTLVMLDPMGHELARLVPPSGARITSVMARNGHAVALLSEHEIHAREIALDPVQWGKESPGFKLTISRPVLAPDGKHLAIQSESAGVQIVDLTTGQIASKGLCIDVPSPSEDEKEMPVLFKGGERAVAPVGFVDKSTLACVTLGHVVWWNLDGTKRPGEHSVVSLETVAIANGLTVTSDRESLVLVAGTSTQYLGYGLANPNMVRTGPLGLAVGQGNVQLLLDPALHTRKRYDIPPDLHELDDAMVLDDTHVLISRADTSSGSILHHLAVVDVATHETTQLPLVSTSYELRYDATTHLLAIVEKDYTTLAALDPKTFQVGARSRVAGPAASIYFTDPALANGVVAIGTRSADGRVKIDELVAGDLGVVVPRNSYEVFGDVLAVDRTGRAYVADGDAVHVYTGGEWHKANRVAKLAGLGHVVVRPNSSATELLVIGDNRLQMFNRDGVQQWMVAAPTAFDGTWIEGEPYVRFSAGLAKVDALTGKLLDRACGWGFGLSPARFEVQGDSRSVCDEG